MGETTSNFILGREGSLNEGRDMEDNEDRLGSKEAISFDHLEAVREKESKMVSLGRNACLHLDQESSRDWDSEGMKVQPRLPTEVPCAARKYTVGEKTRLGGRDLGVFNMDRQ